MTRPRADKASVATPRWAERQGPTARAPAWHRLPVHEVAGRLRASAAGLPEAEAAARRQEHGANEIRTEPPPSLLSVVVDQFRSPLIFILLAAAAVTVVVGELVDAAVIAAVLALNAMIGSYQQRRAERSVRALQQLLTPRARVLRDGHEHDVDSRELVPGDVVLLESGVRVPADVRLMRATALRVDESLLTGESLPVDKRVEPVAADTPLADRRCMVFASTVVASGRGAGFVVATGMDTELGAIAEHIRAGEVPATPLQERVERFARLIGSVVVVSALAAFGLGLALGEPLEQMFVFAVALAVSAVPEGLPVVFTIALAVGVNRMARRQAIIRRMPAVETLGSTTTICSDKTGTLTQNLMTVQELRTARDRFVLPGSDPDGQPLDGERLATLPELHLALVSGVLASEADAYLSDGQLHTTGDPTEAALVAAAARLGLEPWGLRDAHERVGHLPFEPDRRFAAAVAKVDGGERLVVQGAVERVLDMCDSQMVRGEVQPLARADIDVAAADMASSGLRVLAFASRQPADTPMEEPAGLTFLALQGMVDPPRPGVRQAVQACAEAGIGVLMVTGDHAGTASAVAREVGLLRSGREQVLTGRQLDSLDEEALQRVLPEVGVFARVAPHHKLRVVRALRAQDEVVAVTGDGVNDAPALHAADIGIAMGRSGTDVAREAADMVLADDDFTTIRAAVEEGRITFDNLRKVTFFLISTGAAEIAMLLTALALRWPLLLLPAQLLWLNLVTNGLQDVALAFEPGEPNVLRRRPRARGEGLLSPRLWERTALVALVMAAGTLWAFQSALAATDSLGYARTAAVTTMVLFQAVHVGNSRSVSRSAFSNAPWSNRFLLASVIAALALHAAALHLPPTQYVLRLEPLAARTWASSAVISLTVLLAVELHKLLRPDREASRQRS